jgi:DNA processing protein
LILMEHTQKQSADELTPWLRLMLTEGVGNTSARKLLAAFGLPKNIFEQPSRALEQVISKAQAQALQTPPEKLPAQTELCATWLRASANRAIVTLGDALYPPALLTLPDPPLVLWLMGRIDLLSAQGWPASLAMVGSRNPSQHGEKNAHAFAKNFVESGLCVVSGMALGIDAAAHFGALAANDKGLQTLAVVGTGLDRVYPKQNLELAHAICDKGLILSEFPLDTPPASANFPKRNRIIAALGLGTLVVEAALQSGSLITARESLDLGKDVFAIPGSIHVAQSKGCHALIKQGAKLVDSAQDVLEELNLTTRAAYNQAAKVTQEVLSQITGNEHPLLASLGVDPVSFDVLQVRTGVDPANLQVQLLELELTQKISRLPGGLYQIIL